MHEHDDAEGPEAKRLAEECDVGKMLWLMCMPDPPCTPLRRRFTYVYDGMNMVPQLNENIMTARQPPLRSNPFFALSPPTADIGGACEQVPMQVRDDACERNASLEVMASSSDELDRQSVMLELDSASPVPTASQSMTALINHVRITQCNSNLRRPTRSRSDL